jgi:hypothetical protein
MPAVVFLLGAVAALAALAVPSEGVSVTPSIVGGATAPQARCASVHVDHPGLASV